MNRSAFIWIPVLVCVVRLASVSAQTVTPPRLLIQALANQKVVVTWTNDGSGLVLEQAGFIGSPTLWQPIRQTPLEQNNQFSVTFDASIGSTFFRLHSPPLTSIRESSPVNGETGVAVLRETIVRFTAPLATNVVVTTNNFYAGYGGRRLLSRVELSSDRTKATLFYLEPMPGSTRVVAVFDGAGLTDFTGRPLDPDGDGQAGGVALIAFDTLNLTALAGTAVIGRVFASELLPGSDTGTNAVNRPLEGVTITVDGREQDLRTTTDALGNFTLTPAPPGRFFVKIDGRTARGSQYPNGAYYPYVGKAWDAVAGRTNNLAGGTGEIYLPLITAGTLQPVSMTSDTTISFPPSVVSSNPALAGVSITVPANSLFSDDGTRGGKVGIAPVPPDRLPGPLPPGLEPPLVITVQTDGPLNFDKPAPVCFPNLPDPVLGVPLPAGSKQALISFNHKKGVWEGVGSMTVSADGKMICTDPGVGILQPGWHGVGPQPTGPPPPPPACNGNEGQLSGPPGSSCCTPDFKKLAICNSRADRAGRGCILLAVGFAGTLAASTCFESFGVGCVLGAAVAAFGPLVCSKIRQESLLDCKEDNDCSSTSTSSAVLQSPLRRIVLQAPPPTDDPTLDAVLSRLNQIEALIYPPYDGHQLLDPVKSQVAALLNEATQLAGGDLQEFIREKFNQMDDDIGQIDAEIGEAKGNAPAYPVAYAALVQRPTSFIILRGETQPLGQYSLFIPRDGTLISVSFYDPKTKSYGLIFPHTRPNPPYALPRFTLVPTDSTWLDYDQDGLSDAVELVLGTDPAKADTDGDGIPDGAEVDQGTNPLDGLAVQTGIIATAKTPGKAVDVCANNNLAVLAERDAGVSVFNIFNQMNPTLIAQVDTPGDAQRVACSANFIAVADGLMGLAIIDISAPASARIVHQVDLPGTAQAVSAAGTTAFVGLDSGVVAAVDMSSGTILSQAGVGSAIMDLGVSADYLYLYALTADALHAVSLRGDQLTLLASVASPFEDVQITGQPLGNKRLSIASGIAYAVHSKGYNTFNLTDPANPTLIAAGSTTQVGWKQIVPNGSGLGLAAVSPMLALSDPTMHNISLYDLSDPTKTDVFLTMFPTPGFARAVALYNGLAYVADDVAGLQVINYLAYDAKGVAPSITLRTQYAAGLAEPAKPMRVWAIVADDVQVRNVEFYVDDVLSGAAGRYPFEAYVAAPGVSATKTNFTLRARAIDTGGNSTWSTLLTLNLVPDATPPRVTQVTPADGSIASSASTTNIIATFSEPIKPATLPGQTFQLFSAGPDGVAGTADDVAVPGGTTSYRTNDNSASLDFDSPLPAGFYRAVLRSGITDLAGNGMAADFAWTFRLQSPVFWAIDTNGLWNVATNWNTHALPQTNDLVVIDRPGKDVTVRLEPDFVKANHQTVYSLMSQGALVLTGGTLELAQPSEVNNALTLSGGTLSVATELTISGPLIWMTQGTLDGGGVTLAKGGITIAASNNVNNGIFIGNQTINNAGLTTWSSLGGIQFNDPAGVFNNLPGATFDAQTDEGMVFGGFVPPFARFNNEGTFIKSAGTNKTWVTVGFFNSGTVEVRSGTLNLSGGGRNTGVFKVDAGSALQFSSDYDVGSAGIVGGDGAVQFSGGTIMLDGTYDVAGGTTIGPTVTVVFNGSVKHLDGSFTVFQGSFAKFNGPEVSIQVAPVIAGGVAEFNQPGPITLPGLTVSDFGKVTGPGDIIVTGPLVLTNAAMYGPGRTMAKDAVRISGSLALHGTASFNSVNPRNFDNFGAATWSGANSVIDLGVSNVFNNLPGATFEVQTDAGFGGGAYGSVFKNAGTFRKSAGNGTMTCGVLFQNAGTVELLSGTVNFTSGFVQTDGATRLSGGNIQAFPSFAILGGSLSGSGSVDVFAFTNAASISPGASAGLLMFKGNYTQTATGSLNFEIGGALPGTGFDQISVNNAATLGGALDIALINGYQPNLGDTFAVLTCGSRTGTFATVSGLVIGNGKQFQVNYGAQGVTLSVVAAP